MHDNAFQNMLRPAVAQPEEEDDAGLPSQVEGEYQPYARPANKPVYALHFIRAKGEIRTFQYIHLDSDSRYTPECITLRFVGMEPVTVRIEGRKLRRLYELLHQHRCPWIAASEQDFAEDGQPVVLKVRFESYEPVS